MHFSLLNNLIVIILEFYLIIILTQLFKSIIVILDIRLFNFQKLTLIINF